MGAGVKNALPALGVARGKTGAKAKDTSKRYGEETGSAGVRRGGKDTLVRLRRRGNPARATTRVRREGLLGGGMCVGRTPPRARGRRTHSARAAGAPTRVGVCATARAERVGCECKTDLRNQG